MERVDRDEARQILRERPEPVSDPRAHRRSHERLTPRVQRDGRLHVGIGARLHSVEHAQFVRVLRELRKNFRDHRPALPARIEFEDRAEQLMRPAFANLREFRFPVERLEMARPALHEEEDLALRSRGEVRRFISPSRAPSRERSPSRSALRLVSPSRGPVRGFQCLWPSRALTMWAPVPSPRCQNSRMTIPSASEMAGICGRVLRGGMDYGCNR